MTTFSVTIGPDDLPDGNYTAHIEAVDASVNANETDTTEIGISVQAAAVTPISGPRAIRVEIAFGQAPFAPDLEWTDVTADVLYESGITVVRGATAENPVPTPGTVSYVLKDTTRKYDPTNSAGDLFGTLTPGCPTRVTLSVGTVSNAIVTHTAISSHSQIVSGGATTYPVGYGYIDGFPQAYTDQADKLTKIDITAPDGLSRLALMSFMPAMPATCATDVPEDLAEISAHNSIVTHRPIVQHASYPDSMLVDTDSVLADPIPDLDAEVSGTRILELLTFAGIDPTALSIDPGQTLCEGGFPEEKNLLDHIRLIVATELGRFFQEPDGHLRFVERQSSERERQVAQATFGEATGTGVPYVSLELDPADRRFLVNRCVRSSRSVTEQVVQSQESINRYGTFEDSQVLAFHDIVDATNQAIYIVGIKKDAPARVNTLVVKPDRDPAAMFPAILAADIGWMLEVSRTPQGVGTEILQFVTAEQITHQFDQTSWTSTFDLGAADTDPYGHTDADDLTDTGVLVAY